MFPWALRFLYRPLDGPTSVNAISQRSWSYAGVVGPFSDGLSRAVDCEETIRASIHALLARCAPSAILRRVGAVVVDAVKRMRCGGALTHVAQKCGEVVTPFLAYSDASTAISLVGVIIGIEAARQNSSPYLILSGAVPAVNYAAGACDLSLETAAAASWPFTAKLLGANGDFGPAFAATAPEIVVSNAVGLCDYHQAARNMAEHIAACSHMDILPQRTEDAS